MEYLSKRELGHYEVEEKWRKMYKDVRLGISWDDLALKYKYKNGWSVRTVYYRYIVPLITKEEKERS